MAIVMSLWASAATGQRSARQAAISSPAAVASAAAKQGGTIVGPRPGGAPHDWTLPPPPVGAMMLQFAIDKVATSLTVTLATVEGLRVGGASNVHARVHVHPNGTTSRAAAMHALIQQRNHVPHQFKRITRLHHPLACLHHPAATVAFDQVCLKLSVGLVGEKKPLSGSFPTSLFSPSVSASLYQAGVLVALTPVFLFCHVWAARPSLSNWVACGAS